MAVTGVIAAAVITAVLAATLLLYRSSNVGWKE
jgi:hypothetical protein